MHSSMHAREHPHRSAYAAIALLAATTLTSACASAPAASPFDERTVREAGPEEDPIRIQVTNNNWQDITLYFQPVGGGRALRVGRVTSLNTETFKLKYNTTDRIVRLAFEPLGSRGESEYLPPVQVNPGEFVEVTVENQIGLSHVEVRATP